ncbi:MAG: 2-C-methyl-D-erythritol 2,4-cyclodiphosphate synthase [bacterium]
MSDIPFRIGIGYDTHRLEDGRPLILGGVKIDHSMGLAGHSDADVVVHALIDAMLGAAGLGDIGSHFPDTDESYLDADSIGLLKDVIELLSQRAWKVSNVDVTLLAEKPVVAPHIEDMVKNIENAGLGSGTVNIKATRGEGMGFVGRGEGMAALAVAMIRKIHSD